jgi:hypothetical protein
MPKAPTVVPSILSLRDRTPYAIYFRGPHVPHIHFLATKISNAPALIGLIGVLLASTIGFIQWRKSRDLEKEKLRWTQALETQKLQWEREKLILEAQLDREKQKQQRVDDDEFAHAKAVHALADATRTQADHAANYRASLVTELRSLKILDMSRPLDLASLYVDVRVREDQPGRYVPDDDISKVSAADPMDFLRQSQVQIMEKSKLAMSAEEALRKYRRVVMLGDPGAGKTTMLRHLAYRMAIGDWPEQIDCPIYVELRRFIDSGLPDLLDFVSQDWDGRYGFSDARPYLEQALTPTLAPGSATSVHS